MLETTNQSTSTIYSASDFSQLLQPLLGPRNISSAAFLVKVNSSTCAASSPGWGEKPLIFNGLMVI